MKQLCLIMSSLVETGSENEPVVKSSRPIFIDDYKKAVEWIAEQNKRNESDMNFKFIYWIQFIDDFRKGAQ